MLKKIVLKVEERELDQVKNVLRSFKESSPEVSFSALRHGTLGDDTLVSFNVDEKYYKALINRLAVSGINVLLPASKTEKENAQVKFKSKTIITNERNKSGINTPFENKQASGSPVLILDNSIVSGDYEKVIQVSKDIKAGFELMKKAKDNIEKSVNNAITVAFDKALKSSFEMTNGFNQLVRIASDKTLKAMHLVSLQKTAGLNAVKLCAGRREYLNLLIQICNNNSIPNIVCVKASAELAAMVSDEQESEQNGNEDLEYAVRYLNIKWLQIALDLALNEASQTEINSVKNLISTVRKIRNERLQ